MSSRRPFIALMIGILLLAAACASEEDAPPATSTAATSGAASALVDPDEFARRVEEPNTVTINVHIPNEGDIAGTDLAIAFDQIDSSTELPDDHATPLAVYCLSGNMSATAAEDLRARGYLDIVELRGGYEAWLRSGRALEER
jgi:rhodanese-related sulfurtransferase